MKVGISSNSKKGFRKQLVLCLAPLHICCLLKPAGPWTFFVYHYHNFVAFQHDLQACGSSMPKSMVCHEREQESYSRKIRLERHFHDLQLGIWHCFQFQKRASFSGWLLVQNDSTFFARVYQQKSIKTTSDWSLSMLSVRNVLALQCHWAECAHVNIVQKLRWTCLKRQLHVAKCSKSAY